MANEQGTTAVTGRVPITLAEENGTLLGSDGRTVWVEAVPRSGELMRVGGEVREVARVVHLAYPNGSPPAAADAVSPVVLLRRRNEGGPSAT